VVGRLKFLVTFHKSFALVSRDIKTDSERLTMTSQSPTHVVASPAREKEGSDTWQKRALWLRRSRVGPDGRAVPGVYLKAARQRRKLGRGGVILEDKPVPAPGVNWTPIGPSVIQYNITQAGRVTSLLAGPGGTRVYAGAADGGVWFSVNSGATWTPLDDYFSSPASVPGDTGADANSLSIGAIEIRFGSLATDDEIFIGTGEANAGWPSINVDVNPFDNYFGVGIRHRVGGIWTLEATNLASQGIYRIAIDPNDVTPTNVFAATTTGLFKRPMGGADPSTWKQIQVNPTNINLPVTDFIAAGTGPGRMFYAAVNGDNVYSSPDGTTWTALSGLGTIPNNEAYGRIALGASESSPNIIYAIIANGNFFRLDASVGTTFQSVLGLPSGVPFGGQGSYDIGVTVDPIDPTTVYLSGDGLPLYKGAVTFVGGSYTFPAGGPAFVGAGIHADVHAVTFALNSAGTAHDPTSVWVGSDGGVYQSGMSGAAGSFQGLNLGLAISQCYSFGQRSDTDAVVLTGLQDNGGLRMLSEQAALETAEDIVGDGGSCVYHPTDPYRALMQFKGTGLAATTDGGASWTQITTFPPPPPYSTDENSENSATAFIAPIAAVADSAAPGGAQLAFGTNRLWLSSDWGVTWVTLPTGANPYSSSPPNLSQDVIDPTASSLAQGVTAIAFASPTQVYAATTLQIWRYDYSGGSWSKTALPTSGFPAGYYITGVAVENAASGSIYITLGGGSIPHVQYYDGSTWYAAMPTSILDVPAHAVVVDPATFAVYVGTDVGCWRGTRTGTAWSWSASSNGLPQCAILQLGIHENAYLLRAATCGRGIWEVPLDTTAVGLDPDIYLRVNYADTGRLKGGSRYPWVEGAADPVSPGLTVYHWMSADIKVRRSSLSGLPPISSPATYLDFAFNIGDYVQPSTNIETADVSGTDSIFVEVHNRSLNAVTASNVRVLLLVADASAALPALPSGWTSHVNSGDTSSAWLGSSGWQFVDFAQPYRTLPGDLDVRMPQVVEYLFDFSTLGLPPGHDHVCLAAFVTTVDSSDHITSVDTDLNTVTMTDKHVAHRNLHLVALGAKPLLQKFGFNTLNFNNPYDQSAVFDFEFTRQNFPGEIVLLLPKLSELSPAKPELEGFRLQRHQEWSHDLRQIVGDWIEDLGEFLENVGQRIEGHPADVRQRISQQHEHRRQKLERLDHSHILLAEAGPESAKIAGVQIPPRSGVLGAFALRSPSGAKKGDRYRLDVIQRRQGKVLGGSSYVIAII
jgi:hypothetical protein